MEEARKAQDAPVDQWVSAPVAAKRLGIAIPTVYARALRRELVSQVVGGRVFIHVDCLPSEPQQAVG